MTSDYETPIISVVAMGCDQIHTHNEVAFVSSQLMSVLDALPEEVKVQLREVTFSPIILRCSTAKVTRAEPRRIPRVDTDKVKKKA